MTETIARLAIANPGIIPHPNASQAPETSDVLLEAQKSVMAVVSEASMRAVVSDPLNVHAIPTTREVQRDGILKFLSAKIETAMASLQSANGAPDSLWEKADNVKAQLAIVADSLQPLKETAEKAIVVDEMRKLESQLKEFTATLPKDVRPLHYNSGKSIILSIFFLALICIQHTRWKIRSNIWMRWGRSWFYLDSSATLSLVSPSTIQTSFSAL